MVSGGAATKSSPRQVAVMERPKDTQQLLSLVASGSRLLAKL
jgi:hypothetical protein